jgi:multidrug efflux pump
VAIVLAVSIIALGLHKGGRFGWYIDMRPGLVVAITIPLVLAVTFLAMNYFGIGLHKISLGSLIIALGLLVDDAIIAVEMMVRKMEEGYDKARAATYAYDVTAKPVVDRLGVLRAVPGHAAAQGEAARPRSAAA